MMPSRHHFISSSLALLIFLTAAGCGGGPGTRAEVGEDQLHQTVTYEKLFAKPDTEGLFESVLITRDDREEMARWEKTLIVSFQQGRHTVYELPTHDRKRLGQDKVRQSIAAFWPVTLEAEAPLRPVLVVKALAEFTLPSAGGDEEGEATEGGINDLSTSLELLEVDRKGNLVTREPKPIEAATAIAAVLARTEEEGQAPLPWRLLLKFYLAERHRETGEKADTVKAATGYQWILDTVAHARPNSDFEDFFVGGETLLNVAYIESMATKRLESMK